MIENKPKMMTIRQFAKTGLLTEHAIRMLIKQKRIPAIFIGSKALLDYDAVTEAIQKLADRNVMLDAFEPWS
jgi:excisionase family DNA binding protein